MFPNCHGTSGDSWKQDRFDLYWWWVLRKSYGSSLWPTKCFYLSKQLTSLMGVVTPNTHWMIHLESRKASCIIMALNYLSINIGWWKGIVLSNNYHHVAWELWFRKSTCYMMTSSNGNILRVTGPLCGEITGDRWIPLTKASDAELWCFFDLRLE